MKMKAGATVFRPGRFGLAGPDRGEKEVPLTVILLPGRPPVCFDFADVCKKLKKGKSYEPVR